MNTRRFGSLRNLLCAGLTAVLVVVMAAPARTQTVPKPQFSQGDGAYLKRGTRITVQADMEGRVVWINWAFGDAPTEGYAPASGSMNDYENGIILSQTGAVKIWAYAYIFKLPQNDTSEISAVEYNVFKPVDTPDFRTKAGISIVTPTDETSPYLFIRKDSTLFLDYDITADNSILVYYGFGDYPGELDVDGYPVSDAYNNNQYYRSQGISYNTIKANGPRGKIWVYAKSDLYGDYSPLQILNYELYDTLATPEFHIGGRVYADGSEVKHQSGLTIFSEVPADLAMTPTFRYQLIYDATSIDCEEGSYATFPNYPVRLEKDEAEESKDVCICAYAVDTRHGLVSDKISACYKIVPAAEQPVFYVGDVQLQAGVNDTVSKCDVITVRMPKPTSGVQVYYRTLAYSRPDIAVSSIREKVDTDRVEIPVNVNFSGAPGSDEVLFIAAYSVKNAAGTPDSSAINYITLHRLRQKYETDLGTEILCHNQTGPFFVTLTNNRPGKITWKVTNPKNEKGETVQVITEGLKSGNQIRLSLKSDYNPDTTRVVTYYASEESCPDDYEIQRLVVPRKAKTPAELVIKDRKGGTVDTVFCEQLNYDMYIKEEDKTDYSFESRNIAPLNYHWMKSEQEDAGTMIEPITASRPDPVYGTDPEKPTYMYASAGANAYIPKLEDKDKFFTVIARTCDGPGVKPKTTPRAKKIENIVRLDIVDSNLYIKAIKYDSEWKEDKSGYACSYYEDEIPGFNLLPVKDEKTGTVKEYSAAGNGVYGSKKNVLEASNGHVYLQAEPYEFDNLTDIYTYEWIFDSADLEIDSIFMQEHKELRENNFAPDKGRCCFKVKHTEGRSPKIKVRYKIYCKHCKELAEIDGFDPDGVFEKEMDEEKPFTFNRIDSIPYIVDYKPYISQYNLESDSYSDLAESQDGVPLLCGNVDYGLCVKLGMTVHKDSANAAPVSVPDSVYTSNWLFPGYTPGLCPGSQWSGESGRPCARIKTPLVGCSENEDEENPGVNLYFSVYPSNVCFKNGRHDAGRTLKLVDFFLSARPKAPRLIDILENPNREFKTPTDRHDRPSTNFEGDEFPSVLMCNYNQTQTGHRDQNFLIRTTHGDKSRAKPSDGGRGNYGFGLVMPEGFVGEGDDANYDFNVIPYGDHAATEFVDTAMLSIRFLNTVPQAHRQPMGVYISNQCGAGDTGWFPLKIIDTLAVPTFTYKYELPRDPAPGEVCEGTVVEINVDISKYITAFFDKGRNTDSVGLVWMLPGCEGMKPDKCNPWDFLLPQQATSTKPQIKVGTQSGSPKLALVNRCGISNFNSTEHFKVIPFTRVDVYVTDLTQDPFIHGYAFGLTDPEMWPVRGVDYSHLVQPCTGADMLYTIDRDTVNGADEYRWMFPEGWTVWSYGEPGVDYAVRMPVDTPNWVYTRNDSVARRTSEMRVLVRVGPEAGNLFVIGSKKKCNYRYDNIPEEVLKSWYGHRADTIPLPIRPNAGRPLLVDTLGWDWKMCVRTPHWLTVLPADQDSLTAASSYYSWKFYGTGWDTVSYDYSTSDAYSGTFTVDERTYTITDSNIQNKVFIPSIPDYVTWPEFGNKITVHANRFDCPDHTGDSTVFKFMSADTLSLDPGGKFADLADEGRYFGKDFPDKKFCEGDTVLVIYYPYSNRRAHDSLDYIWYKWNGGNELMYADWVEKIPPDKIGDDTTYIYHHTDSIDSTGWKVLNPRDNFADSLKLVVGRTPMVISAYGVSYCGWSSPKHSDTIWPIIKIRDTAHWIGRYEILCETEELEIRHDSILHAEGYEWVYPWCDKELIIGRDTLPGDTLTVKGRPANIPYRTFKAGTVYDSGKIYVRPYNYCGYGPTSDTVEVVSLVHPLARPDSVQWIVDASADPMTGMLLGKDSVLYDTLCLRTDTLYCAFFTDTLYPDAKWKYGWFGLSIHPSDSIGADSCMMRFLKRGGRGTENTVGVAVRHPACRRYGDTLVLKIFSIDTLQMPGNSMQQCLLNLLNEDANMVVTKLCGVREPGVPAPEVLWTVNRSMFNDPTLDSTKFVWRKTADLAFARDYTAGPPVILANGITWKNQRADRFYVHDSLHMEINNGDSLQVAVHAHNRCGYSRLPYVTIKIVNAVHDVYPIGVLNPVERTDGGTKDTLYCDKETVTFVLDYQGDSVNDFVWVLPWKRDTTRSESPVYIVNDTNLAEEALINLQAGRVYAIPRNGCGTGFRTDSILLKNIMRERPVAERDKVQDSLCMHDEFMLTVNLPGGGGKDSIRVIWDASELPAGIVAFDSVTQDAVSATAKVQQYHIKQRSEPYRVSVSTQVIGCRRISEPLVITLVPMDTLEFVTDVVSDEFLGPYQVRFEPLLVSSYSCEGSVVNFPLRDQFHWSLKGPASYMWCGRDGVYETAPREDSLMASTAWKLNADGSQTGNGGLYTALALSVGSDSLWLRLRLENICGSSLSPSLIQRPKYHVTQKPSFRFPDNFCIDQFAVFTVEGPWPDFAETLVVEKEWAPGRSIYSIGNQVPAITFTDSITELTQGDIRVRAANGCAPDGPDSVLTLKTEDIILPPLRPEPAWFEAMGIPEESAVWHRGDRSEGNRRDTVVQWMCLYENRPLAVNRHGNRSHVKTRWMRVKADGDLILMDTPANPDTVGYPTVNTNALPKAGDDAIFAVWSEDEICHCQSDTLYIQIVLVDTVPASDYRLDWTAADPDVEDLHPEPCIGSEIMFTVRDTATGSTNDSLYYRWSIPAGWEFRTSADSTYHCEMGSDYDRFPLPDTTDNYSIVVKVGSNSGSVRVQVGGSRYRSGCSTFSVPVTVPVQADTFHPRKTLVTGTLQIEDNDATPCAGSVITYKVQSPASADREPKAWAWTVPGDWVITDIDKHCDSTAYSGDTVWRLDYTGTCTVRVGKTAGQITVTALDSCCGYVRPGNTVSLAVTVIDTARFTILGDHHSCIDSIIDLTVEANAFGDPHRYSLRISGPGAGGFRLAFDTVDAATGKVDSSHLMVSGSSFDTVYLTFTPVNTYGCATNVEPLVWWVKADTTPEIHGWLTGPATVCEDNLYLFTFHLDDPEGKIMGRVRTEWSFSDNSWEVAEQLNDSSALLRFKKIPTLDGYPLPYDTVFCAPVGICGTAPLQFLVIELKEADVFEDSIMVSTEAPCLGRGIEAWLRDKDDSRYNDTDAYRVVWGTPSSWTLLSDDTLSVRDRARYTAELDSIEPVITARLWKQGSCGLSKTLHRTVLVRDSAEKLVPSPDVKTHPCFKNEEYIVNLLPAEGQVDSVEWFVRLDHPFHTFTYTAYTTNPGSGYKYDSLVIDNVLLPSGETYTKDVYVTARSWNECGSRDALIILTPISSITPIDGHINVPRVCVGDDAYAYIEVPAEHTLMEGITYGWSVTRGNAEVMEQGVDDLTVSWMRWHANDSTGYTLDSMVVNHVISGDSTVAVTQYFDVPDSYMIHFTAANDCFTLEDSIEVRPFSFVFESYANPDTVPYGTTGVVLGVSSVTEISTVITPGRVNNYDYTWEPADRLLAPNPGEDFRRTSVLVCNPETYYVVAKQKPAQSPSVPAYQKDALCKARGEVKIWLDSVFSMRLEMLNDTLCVDEAYEMKMNNEGGSDLFMIDWYELDDNDSVWNLLAEDRQSVVMQFNDPGRYTFMAVGRDSTVLYRADSSILLTSSSVDTVIFSVVTYDLDMRFTNVASDVITDVPLGSVLELGIRVTLGTGDYHYSWEPEAAIARVDEAAGMLYTAPVFGTRSFVFAVTDSTSHCRRELPLTVEPGSGTRVPNTFTPNNDGINDLFMEGVNILSIYSRWGELLVRIEDGRGWDGTYKGKRVRPGEYLYVAEISELGPEGLIERTIKGVVTVKYE